MLMSQSLLYRFTKDEKQKPAIYKYYDYTKDGTDIVDYRIGKHTVKKKSQR